MVGEARRSSGPSETNAWNPARILVGIFTDDLKTKAVALVCAVFIWFLVSGLISDQVERIVPVKVQSVDPIGIWSESSAKYLRVLLEGPRESLRSLEPERLARAYSVEPEQLDPGESSRSIDLPADDFLELPPGVRATSIEPARIRVDIQRVTLRHVKVEATIQGQPGKGYKVSDLSLSPSEIRILVPHDVGERDFVRTKAIDVSGRDHSFTQRVEVQPQIDGRRVFLLDDRPIQVRVGIEELADEVEVDVDVLILLPASYGLRVKEMDPKTVRVRVSGPRSRLPSAKEIKLYVDLRQREQDLIRRDIEYPHHFDLREDVPVGLRVVEKYVLGGSGQKEPVERVKVLFVEP